MTNKINFLKVTEQAGQLNGEFIGSVDTLDQVEALEEMRKLCSTIWSAENMGELEECDGLYILGNEVFGLGPQGSGIPSGETSTWIGTDAKDKGLIFMVIDADQDWELIFTDFSLEAVPVQIKREN